jgi:hypothetical protein
MSERADQSRHPSTLLGKVKLVPIKTYEGKKECFSSVKFLFFNTQLEMAPCESAERALSLIETDKSKVLGLLIGKHNVKPGQQVPKAGMSQPSGQLTALNSI